MDATDRLLPSLEDARILLVDDDPGAIEWMGRVLAGYRDLRFATDGAQALAIARSWLPELVLLDAEMPGTDGYAVCRALKADPLLAAVPVLFVTQHREPQVEAAVFELGAADFISKPVAGPALLARVAMQLRLRRMTRLMARLLARDALTGLADRSRLDDELLLECARSQRSGRPLALLLVKGEGLAAYERQHGPAMGDRSRRLLANAVGRLCQRTSDLAARQGADAFAVLMPETTAERAMALGAQWGAVWSPGSDLGSDQADYPAVAAISLSLGLAVYAPGGSAARPSAPGRAPSDAGGPDDTEPTSPTRLAADLQASAELALAASQRAGGGKPFLCRLATSGRDLAGPTPMPL